MPKGQCGATIGGGNGSERGLKSCTHHTAPHHTAPHHTTPHPHHTTNQDGTIHTTR